MEVSPTPMPWPRPFTSALNRRETILVLIYLPLHLLLLQFGFGTLAALGKLPEATANLLYYMTGFLYLLLSAFGFLRRDFDPLIDAPFRCLREILGGYVSMLCFNYLIAMLLMLLPDAENPNNAAVMATVEQDLPTMKALLVYLAPFVEELLFRAGVFGTLRRKNRLAAYLVSVLFFSLYHVAPYAIYEPVYWLFLFQYLPASFLLARCYERTNSIWCSIFFHMLINGVSLSALNAFG